MLWTNARQWIETNNLPTKKGSEVVVGDLVVGRPSHSVFFVDKIEEVPGGRPGGRVAEQRMLLDVLGNGEGVVPHQDVYYIPRGHLKLDAEASERLRDHMEGWMKG